MATKALAAGIILVGAVLFSSCRKEIPLQDPANYSTNPLLPEKAFDYPQSSNDHAAALGRVLFYDRSLSLNNSIACGSCHQQSKAFCDNMRVSVGLEDKHTERNTPSIFAKDGRLFWDGRAGSFNNLSLMPVKNHVEMRFGDLNALCDKLEKLNYYPGLFKKAFGQSTIDSIKMQAALGEFLRNFAFSNHKLNRERQHAAELSVTEKLGKDLFFGKARCSNCHVVLQETVTVSGGGGWGGGGGTPTRTGINGYGFTDMEFCIGLDESYADNGIGTLNGSANDHGKFMVPVLLNIEYTAPYMHDGRFKTLEEVVEHYNSGIKAHPNLDIALRDLSKYPGKTIDEVFAILDVNKSNVLESSEMVGLQPVRLGLDENEKRQLVEFLKTLSDPGILTDVKFSDPFQQK
jgi:cytochrome c peroxidase